MTDRTPSRLDRLAAQKVPLAVIVVAGAFVAGGFNLGFPSGRFPVMLGSVTIALALLEIFGSVFLASGPIARRSEPIFDRNEIKAILWICTTIVLIFLVGILPGSFAAGLIFTRLIERRKTLISIAISAGITFVIWFAFSYLAGFEMFPGILRR